jgi:hypothetical protein
MSRERKSRLLVCFAVTVLIMGNTIRHMFEGIRPFDWLMLVIETAVLALIAWEIGRDIWHKRKMRRWHDTLSGLMSKGQKLRWRQPNDDEPVAAWENSAKAWIRETGDFLEQSSPKAAAWFLQEVDSSYYEISRNKHFWDTALFTRIQNLRDIMEKCDVYF